MHDDVTALRRFAEARDERAFTSLVDRHLGLVYAAALRQVNGDAHLARDVAQGVFIALARKAGELARRRTPLAGWLYTSTHHEAAHAVRAEQRRRRREQEAQAMQEISDDSAHDAAWAQVRPHLDAAMQRLSQDDREALVQRFFAGRSFTEVATVLGVTESGARMRVERALGKLRQHLERRGIRSTMAALGAVLATEAVAAPPVGLATSVAAAAMATAGGAGAAGALGLLGMTKLQTTLVAAAAVVGLTAVGVELHEQRQARARVDALADEVASVDAGRSSPVMTTRPESPAMPEPARLGQLRAEKAALQERLERLSAATSPAPGTRAGPVKEKVARAETFPGPLADVSELQVFPKPLQQVPPAYPAEMKGSRVQGEVLVSFVVTETGDVVDVQPEEATHPAFALAALDAVAQWKFSPAQKDGMPVNVRLQQPLRFSIHDEEWF